MARKVIMSETTGITNAVRTGHVIRWGIVRTARKQTIAEHMYIVTLIARELFNALKLSKSDPHTGQLRNRLIEKSLMHDLTEIFTGDLPTPVKNNPDIAKGIRRIEMEYNPPEPEISDISSYDYLIQSLLKIADELEAALFLEVEAVDKKGLRIKECILNRIWDRIAECRRSREIGSYNWDAISHAVNSSIARVSSGDY